MLLSRVTQWDRDKSHIFECMRCRVALAQPAESFYEKMIEHELLRMLPN